MIARLRRTRVGRYSMVVGSIAGGLLLLDMLGFVATVCFHKQLLAQAEAAGLGSLLR